MHRTTVSGLLLCLYWASISPAGDRDVPRGAIAFASQTPRGWDVYVSDINTRAATRLTDHRASRDAVPCRNANRSGWKSSKHQEKSV